MFCNPRKEKAEYLKRKMKAAIFRVDVAYFTGTSAYFTGTPLVCRVVCLFGRGDLSFLSVPEVLFQEYKPPYRSDMPTTLHRTKTANKVKIGIMSAPHHSRNRYHTLTAIHIENGKRKRHEQKEQRRTKPRPASPEQDQPHVHDEAGQHVDTKTDYVTSIPRIQPSAEHYIS
jgi:hypothetical protein